jgi:hypothetical protein
MKQRPLDRAREVEISFDIKYLECDLAEERFESHPVLQLYFSNHFIRSQATGGVLSIPLDEHHLNKTYSGKLKATLSRDYAGIPTKSAIGMATWAVHREDNGHPCYVNVGTSHAYMGNILPEVNLKGTYDHSHDLLMRTTVINGGTQIKKGVIEFRVTGITTGTAVSQTEMVKSFLEAPAAEIESTLTQYIQTTMNFESQLPDLLTGTERIRAPMDISQSGTESTGEAFLPIAAFAMIEVPEANDHFFRNAFQVTMARRRLTPGNFHDLDDHEKCRIMGLMVSFGVQSFDYIGDSVEKTNRHEAFRQRIKDGTEEFSNIWASLAGDCEDSAMGIYTTLKAFIATKFDKQRDPELVELQTIAAEYTPFLTLAVVHGQKIGDTEGRGAHMYLPLLPRHQVNEALARTNAGRALLKRTQPVAPDQVPRIMGNAHQQPKVRPPLFCEGTGHIDPLGYKDPLYEQRKYCAMHMPHFNGLKKEIPHEERAPSSFYLANLLGVNSDMINQGINTGAYIYGTVNEKHNPADPSNQHEMVRGVLYTDMLCDSDKMALMPQPSMSAQMMGIIKEANSLRPPPRPLVLDPNQPMAGDMPYAPLESFVKAVKSMKRSGNKARGSVDCFIRPTQITQELIGGMIEDAHNAQGLFDAEYVKEMVTNSICIYRLQLFIQ